MSKLVNKMTGASWVRKEGLKQIKAGKITEFTEEEWNTFCNGNDTTMRYAFKKGILAAILWAEIPAVMFFAYDLVKDKLGKK